MSMFVHTLTIERAAAGSVDDYNTPTYTYATASTVQGLVQPKNAREIAQANQAGVEISDYSIYVRLGVDLDAADRVVYSGKTYQIEGPPEPRPYGSLPHLKANARLVTP